ncbi:MULTISPECIES: tRNA glutamyl-Q(34) synthetase GluQRS [Acinetobacter calcoaceticus/baumannii complex]|uniref:Glutamyl-Q tRNA(Asp) synthetase n=2 Tax=Acinetobacter pittii TaxID=48296 RepID=K9C4I1_ACIPI|nr:MULTISPECIES: tRNA glutamyl-Q(34) synthetase GluQRS [Acinetobacter calcoaceticus/baumannii complex]QNB03747.1 tRNA glutamyl-Q(34) synthetase GluQRS [Acinetobacter baumannii]AUT35835.1 tRNA glutamyl-Q(34) synthetase GluQRS [Acinetobacter pittii]AVN23455.1 tRNA glutamyl-Q(34) synthetase GluQRS [Acinetobacter pittii]EKU66878.1 glutamyl-queuosine tRNA(Asp) synthetase [Acinetobacter pittii]EXE25222.1 glutamyl-queuosine tRNA(Asp) synthetase [Acinetobacter sp. 907131]
MTVDNSPAEHNSAVVQQLNRLPEKHSFSLAQRRNNVPLNRCSYSGRFAPSPTGPLHFGSLITAVASYCDAKAHQGKWFVRVEDTDIPRIYPGSEEHILTSLEAFQFEPDAEIIFQKNRLDIYESVLDQLKKEGLIYACQCTRKMLGSNAIYAGTCRDLNLDFQGQAIRVKVQDQQICFDDRLQGHHCSNLQHDLGDFVLKRRDGIINYQLAVVVDDYLQGITHVVRGADLLDNTERQIWLSQLLGYPQLSYMHLPLAMNDQGQKLSKQNLAQALDLSKAPELLQKAILALGQPNVDLDQPRLMLKQAVAQWNVDLIPHGQELSGTYL